MEKPFRTILCIGNMQSSLFAICEINQPVATLWLHWLQVFTQNGGETHSISSVFKGQLNRTHVGRSTCVVCWDEWALVGVNAVVVVANFEGERCLWMIYGNFFFKLTYPYNFCVWNKSWWHGGYNALKT